MKVESSGIVRARNAAGTDRDVRFPVPPSFFRESANGDATVRTAAWVLVGCVAIAAAGDCAGAERVVPAAASAAQSTPDGSLTGGSYRLDPVIAAGGGESADARLLLVGSVGQADVAVSYGGGAIVAIGFWTPTAPSALDRLFLDGFE